MPSDPSWDDRLAVARRDIYHLAGYHAYAEGSGEGEPLLWYGGQYHDVGLAIER